MVSVAGKIIGTFTVIIILVLTCRVISYSATNRIPCSDVDRSGVFEQSILQVKLMLELRVTMVQKIPYFNPTEWSGYKRVFSKSKSK